MRKRRPDYSIDHEVAAPGSGGLASGVPGHAALRRHMPRSSMSVRSVHMRLRLAFYNCTLNWNFFISRLLRGFSPGGRLRFSRGLHYDQRIEPVLTAGSSQHHAKFVARVSMRDAVAPQHLDCS